MSSVKRRSRSCFSLSRQFQNTFLDFSNLQANVNAYETLVQIHFRYYEFFSHSLIALVFAYAMRRIAGPSVPLGWTDAVFVLLCSLFYVASRDALQKSYERTEKLLPESIERRTINPAGGGG